MASEKERPRIKPPDMCQKIYLTSCVKQGMAPRQRLLKGLTLEVLDVRNCMLAPHDIEALAYALTTNMCVRTLELSGNEVGRSGMETLVDMLEENMTITELRNVDLRNLNLSWNGFGDEGAAAIAESLEDNTTLVTLDLSNNRIGYEGCRAMAKAVGANTSLQKLALSQNPITTQGAIEMLTRLNDNEQSKLQELLLEGIQVTSDADDIFEEIRETRPEFRFVHGGHVISPDILTLKTVDQPEKKCRSSKS
ncbi:LR74B-like protein [Mya arenaria]|uniref:LR74B-like protein n=1 Tax=Mya arenaria TaxID=6604 RepID=A0ABY7FA33_MYAAR|nr:LR74B-like protein [Mya arenaria]